MLVAESRPRTLDWKHSGPLLFGDWGTSRLYVLGLAFYYTAHASVFYLAVMSVIMAVVAWAYTIVCRCFPDGGGVYSSAKQISPTLAVIGATLLICDFIVTASLSAIEGFHYLGLDARYVVFASVMTLLVLGVVNWYGAVAAGRFALVIAIVALVASFVIGVLCLPLIPKGLATAKMTVEGVDKPVQMWESLVRVVLALAGVEAVASMTGLMKKPVERTAKRTIWPVLIEVILLNMVFGIALNALPDRVTQAVPHYVQLEVVGKLSPEMVPPEVKQYRDTALKVLAEHAGSVAISAKFGQVLAMVAGVVFGLLLLSAANTAILAMVSVMYSLSQDKELPRPLSKLNYSGVPWIPLVISAVLPGFVLLFVSDVKSLGELYAIGVVGAISINVLCLAWNKGLDIKGWERKGLWALGVLMVGIFVTIVIAKPNATIFAGSIVGTVLVARFFVRRAAARAARAQPLPTPAMGWLEELRQAPTQLDASKPRIMLAARGRDNAEYAVDTARKRGAVLFAIYVRTLRVLDVNPGQLPRIEDDPQAQETLGTAAVLAKQAGVPFFPIYITSPNIAEEILDYTVTYGCDTLIIGKSRRSVFSRKVAGDVVSSIAEMLPDDVSLVTRSMAPMSHEHGQDHGGSGQGKGASGTH
jgi:amino acid transporter